MPENGGGWIFKTNYDMERKRRKGRSKSSWMDEFRGNRMELGLEGKIKLATEHNWTNSSDYQYF